MNDVIDDSQRWMQRHEPTGSGLSFRQLTGFSGIMYIHGATAPSGPGPPNCKGFTITLRHTRWDSSGLVISPSQRLCLTTHNTHKRHSHAYGGIRTRNPSKRTVADPRRKKGGRWDRPWGIEMKYLLKYDTAWCDIQTLTFRWNLPTFFFRVVEKNKFFLSPPILLVRKLSPAGAKPHKCLKAFQHVQTTQKLRGDTMQTLISAILFVDGLWVNLKSHWFCLVCFHSSTAKKYVG